MQISCKQALNNVAITVTDLQGKEVFSKHLNGVLNEQVSIDGPAGMYFLKITTTTGQSVVKVIKEYRLLSGCMWELATLLLGGAGEVVKRRIVLLLNFVLNGQVSTSNPPLHIHVNRYGQG